MCLCMNIASTDTTNTTTVCWFVMRAYKSEGKAEEKLAGKDGLAYFIPKCYAIRVYHRVKSKRLVPAIPNLVFVHASRSQILNFKSTGSEYIVVPDEQMDSFIKVASQYDENISYYRPSEINLQKGTRVRIHGGKFDGVKGIFMQVRGKRNRRIVIMLEGVIAVTAEVDPDLVEVIS